MSLESARPARGWLGLALLCVAACSREEANAPAAPAGSPEFMALFERLSQAAEAAPRDARARAQLALACEANGHWVEAATHYRAARELDANEPLWALHAAICAEEAGEMETARAALEAAAARFVTHAPIQQRLGVALLDSGEFARSRTLFESLARLRPELAEAWTGVAEAALASGEVAAALAAADRALSLDPDYALPRFLRARCLSELGRESEAAAERQRAPRAQRRMLGDEWSSQAGEYALGFEARFARGVGLLDQGQAQAAADLLAKLARERPREVRVLGNLAMAQAMRGNLGAALASCDAALALEPDSAALHAARARVLLGSNRGEEALAAARRAAELEPRNAQQWALWGSIASACGRGDEAREAWTRALQLDSGNAEFRAQLERLERR